MNTHSKNNAVSYFPNIIQEPNVSVDEHTIHVQDLLMRSFLLLSFILCVVQPLAAQTVVIAQDSSNKTPDSVLSVQPTDTTMGLLNYLWNTDDEAEGDSTHVRWYYRFDRALDPFYRYMDEGDSADFEQYCHLQDSLPNDSTYKQYYTLARLLWEMQRTEEAQRMFLNILYSKQIFYTFTYHSGSDIPGDTSSNSYGYGSYSYSYKHDACLYLCRIALEQKQYKQAWQYLQLALKKYPTYYTCGTGYVAQELEYNSLRAYCYEGLGWHKKLLRLAMPNCLTTLQQPLIRYLKQHYSPATLQKELLKAEKSIRLGKHFEQEVEIWGDIGDSNATHTVTRRIYSDANARIRLFGYTINLSSLSWFDLQDKEVVTRQHYLRAFRKSSFYRDLVADETKGYDEAENHDTP